MKEYLISLRTCPFCNSNLEFVDTSYGTNPHNIFVSCPVHVQTSLDFSVWGWAHYNQDIWAFNVVINKMQVAFLIEENETQIIKRSDYHIKGKQIISFEGMVPFKFEYDKFVNKMKTLVVFS